MAMLHSIRQCEPWKKKPPKSSTAEKVDPDKIGVWNAQPKAADKAAGGLIWVRKKLNQKTKDVSLNYLI